MVSTSLKSFAVALATCSAMQSGPSYLPNFEYIMNGYNIIAGNPSSQMVGGDPGFSVDPIFQVTFAQNRTSADKRYFVPDNTSVNGDLSCALAFSADTQRSMVDYSQNLKAAAKTDFSGWGSAFAASASYQSAQESIQNHSEKVISSMAACSVYKGAIDQPLRPQFSPAFIAQMAKLDDKEIETYYDMMDNFGTHYVENVLMGAKYGYVSYISETAWKSLASNGFGAEASANFNCMDSVSLSGMTSTQIAAAQQYSQAVSSMRVVTFGSRPPANDTAAAGLWSQQAFDQPFPIMYSLKPISDLFENATVNANMVQALAQYCADRTSKTYPGLSCIAPAAMGCLWDSDCASGQQCFKGMCQGQVARLDGTWVGPEMRADNQQPTGNYVTVNISGKSGSYQRGNVQPGQITAVYYDGSSFVGSASYTDNYGPFTISATSELNATAMFINTPFGGQYYYVLTKKVGGNVVKKRQSSTLVV